MYIQVITNKYNLNLFKNHKNNNKNMSYQIQQAIKQNALEMREYVKGLSQWQEEMAIKQRIKSKKRDQDERERKQIQKQNEEAKKREEQERKQKQKKQGENVKNTKKKQLIRDVNNVQDYYRAWDKFDADKQIEKLQQQQLAPYRPYNPYQDSKNNKRAKPKSGLVIKGNRNTTRIKDPTSLKQKGNLHFKVCEYQKAIQSYSSCLNKIQQLQTQVHGKQVQQPQKQTKQRNKLKAVVLSNRAMSYMKINQTAKALFDCNQSLKYDDKYVKTYLRRADCYKKLGRYRDSLLDYRQAKDIAPEEKEAEGQIKKLEMFMAKKVRQAHDQMVVKSVPGMIVGGYRVEIQEVDGFSEDQDSGQKEEGTNYLDEL